MKRTFAKQGLMSLLAGFFLFGFMLLTATRAEAQAQWKPAPEAMGTLLNEVTTLNGQPQTPDVLIHAYYYKAIYRRIEGGMTVEQSVTDALNIFPESLPLQQGFSGVYEVQDVAVSKPQKQVLQNEATALLTD